MGGGTPLVTVIVPALNEEAYLTAALDSILAQDYPLDRVEVVVVDGASTDATREIAKRHLDGTPLARAEVVEHHETGTPGQLNRGLLWAEGDIVVRVDARSRIPANYVRRCVAILADDAIAVTGGSQVAIAASDHPTAVGIARALNNPWAMGWSRYRRPGATSGPSDTVYLGVFRRHDLEAVGGWNETFRTNQDFELNRRLGRRGIVWFEDGLPVDYVPRPNLALLTRQYHRFGRWKVVYWRTTGETPRRRQRVLMAAPVAATALVAGTWWLHPLAPVALGAAGAATALAVEAATSGPPGGLRARAVSIAAMAGVAGGWLSGIARETLHRTR